MEINEAFECVAEMADALQVMAKRMGLWSGAYDEHIARAHAALETAVEQQAIGSRRRQSDGHQTHRDQDDARAERCRRESKECAGQK